MNPEITSITDFRYNRNNGPLTSWETAKSEGVNCQWVVHAFYKEEFGIELPKDFLSKELFFDNSKFFVTVDHRNGEDSYMGDIFIVSRTKQAKPEKFHLAVCLDESQVIHANSFDQEVSVWPMSKLFEMYPIMRAKKRIKPDFFKTVIRSSV